MGLVFFVILIICILTLSGLAILIYLKNKNKNKKVKVLFDIEGAENGEIKLSKITNKNLKKCFIDILG